MERDTETSRFYDHARQHDFGLGRFLSPDTVGGHPANPQSWNRYAYTLGNPMKHVDPDGKLTIVVHGTMFTSKHNPDFTPGGKFFNYVTQTVGDRSFASFGWSGSDNHESRRSAAWSLAQFIKHYKFAPGEQLNIVAHSHGGNVAIWAINQGLGRKVDNLITLGTPSIDAYRLNDRSLVGNWVHLYNKYDNVQNHGGGADDSPMQTGPAARTEPGADNVSWDVDLGPFASHEGLHSPAAWDVAREYADFKHPLDGFEVYWVEQ
jgi:RHS repeat-associated protein